MGLSVSVLPDWYSLAQALALGLIIPLVSAILPIQKVVQKTIADSMNTQRSKTKGSHVEVTEGGKIDYTPYLTFGLLSVVYGIAIFIFLPIALINFNLGLMLTIFFLILIGMILGLSMLSTNI